MKLRLNKTLRAAVMACCVAALSIGAANADFVWNGGDTITADNWAPASSWTLSNPDETINIGGTDYTRITINDNDRFVITRNNNGQVARTTAASGPGTPDSEAWDKIVIGNASTAEGTAIKLEGWNLRLELTGNSTVSINTNKVQGPDTAITVGAGSTLNLNWGSFGNSTNDGNGDSVTLNGTMNVILHRNANVDSSSGNNGATTVKFGTLTSTSVPGSFNLSSNAEGTARTFNHLTFTGVLDAAATSEETAVHYIDLGTYTNDVTVSGLTNNFTAANFTNAGTTALEATEANIGKFSVIQQDNKFRLCYVTGTIGNYTWNGTEAAHVWNAENTNWLTGGSDAAYNSNANLIFAEGASTTVTMTGGDYAGRSIELQAAYTFEVTADSTLATESLTGEGSITKTGDAKLTMASGLAAKVAAVNEGTLAISDRLTGSTFGGGMTVGKNGTLEVTCVGVADGQGTQLVLADASTGTVQVNGGKLRVDSAGATALGGAKLVLKNGTTLNFANSQSNRTSEVSNNIEASGTITLQTWGDATTTANNILSGNITGTADFIKTDGGTLNITGNVTASSITGHNDAGGVLKLSGTVGATNLFAASGTIEITGGTTTVSNVRLSERQDGATSSKILISGGTLKITGTDNTHSTSASLLISHWAGGRDGTLEVNGGALEASQVVALISWAGTGTLSVNGGTAKLKGMNFWGLSGLKGTFNLGAATTGTGVLELGGTGFHEFGSGATINLGNGTIKLVEDSYVNYNVAGSQGTLNLIGTNGGTKFDTNGHNMTIGVRHDSLSTAATMNVAGGGNLVKAGEGTLTFNGTLEAGAITIEGGTLQLNGATTIGQAIANEGELSFGDNGKLVITDLSTWTAAGAASYSDGDNGYLNASYEVVTGSGTISGTATVTVNNEDKTLEDGMLVYAGNGGTYFVNNGEVVYAEGNTIASADTTGITLNGGSLTVQKALAHNVSLAQDATVTIDSDGVVNKSGVTTDGHALTITGSGKYNLGSSIEAGATLASDWTGTVAVSGVSFNADTKIENLSNLGNANSKVQLSGATGYVNGNQNTTTTVSSNLELVNGGTDNVALKITDGYSGNKLLVTGDVTGNGTIKVAATTGVDSLKYEFTGDVSQWDGNFIMADAHSNDKTDEVIFSGTSDVKVNISSTSDTLKATFSGDSATGRTISSNISQDGGTVNLETSGTSGKTFTGTVDVNTLTVAGGAVAFNDNVTANSTTLTDSSIAIANGKTFTSGNETVTAWKDGAATIAGTGAVSVTTEGLTYTNADITLDASGLTEAPATKATLSGSKLTVTNATDETPAVTVNVAEGTTNDFDATSGSITVNTQTASIGTAEVGAGKTLTIGDGTGTATITAEATVAGTVSGNVVVASKATYTAGADSEISGNVDVLSNGTYTANAGSIVNGNVTVATQGTITIASTDGLLVGGDLTLAAGSTLTATGIMDVTDAVAGDVFVLATTVGAIDTTNLANVNVTYTGTLGDNLEIVLSVQQFGTLGALTNPQSMLVATLTSTQVTPPAADVTYASAAWDNGALLVTVNGTLDPATTELALLVTKVQWDEMVKAVTTDGGQTIASSVAVKLTDGTTTIDLTDPAFTGTVTFNGYKGEGNGLYQVQFIPEPATATLSLLALAGLAARRRRKH